jgi:hypothetical protein
VGIEMPVTAKKVVTAVRDLKKGRRKKENGSKSVMDWEEVAERTIKVYESII